MFARQLRIILIVCLLNIPLMGQYWQQWVAYDMHIHLNTHDKLITATSDLTYVNHSPDTLYQVLMHVYPNAFNRGSIIADSWGDYFSANEELTGIQVQNIVAGDTTLAFEIRDDTILDIPIHRPLYPGDTLHFTLNWEYRIHPHVDRSGWEGDQFDFAQWYPKFVVYDENGWHNDPFDPTGEFYGEFGRYQVHFDLPAEQVMGATGVVIGGDPGWASVTVDTSMLWEDWSEAYTERREVYRNELDSTARRQVTFLAENVHDFAWSCSPDYVYEYGNWDGIDIHVLYNLSAGNKWSQDVVKWSQRSLAWLSEKFGRYTWPQITVVEALLGGGMEYPMLVMNDSDSESLVVHEIGHNWFYGIFGNDELDDAWLDEGFTSFQTRWYLEHHYPQREYYLTRKYITPFEYAHLPQQTYREWDLSATVKYTLSPGNQPLATHSYDFTSYRSYNYNVYEKGSFLLEVLRNYLGEERFIAGMQLYYSRWALKHVNEERFIKAMEDASGEELDWLFHQWLYTTDHLDYELADWSVTPMGSNTYLTTIQVNNLGGMDVPISATVFGPSGEQAANRLQEFRHRKTGVIKVSSDFKPIRVFVDAEDVFLDVDRRNNDSQRKSELRYDFKDWSAYPADRNLYLWKPQFGYNDHEGLGLGIQLKRVYRSLDDHLRWGVGHNFRTGDPDAEFSFQQAQRGFPFDITWRGKLQTWRSLRLGSLSTEFAGGRVYGVDPSHTLTLKLDYTDSQDARVLRKHAQTFTRLGLRYHLRDELFSGDFALEADVLTAPQDLGSYGVDFHQLALTARWSHRYTSFDLMNRTNALVNTQGTPGLVAHRLASQDLRTQYLDRLATSFYHIQDLANSGSHYYLPGGGYMRGYADSLDVSENYILSNNLELTFQHVPYVPDYMKFGIFFDLGQMSRDAGSWQHVGDAGISLNFQPRWKRHGWFSTLIRAFQVKLELSILRYEGTGWVNRLDRAPWVFTIST